MDRHALIQTAYKSMGGDATFYDGMITCSTPAGKAVCRLVWDMDKEENDRYLARALEGVPAGFSGRMLEVPVGTGVLTMPLYAALPHADVTCLDYSPAMMARARRLAQHRGLTNVRFVQGDVGALPFADGSLDLVLSLNGFHAFPDKEAAYREILRVLRPGGVFCGCFYIAGEDRRTDWFVRTLYTPRGFFTPPCETRASLRQRLEAQYACVTLTTVKSMASFTCLKA